MLGTRLPLGGAPSIGSIGAWFAGAGGGGAFALSFVLEARRGRDAWRMSLPLVKRVLDCAALTIVFGMLSYLIVRAVAELFALGFQGLTVDPVGGGVLAGAAAAALAYLGALMGSRATSGSVAFLATLQLFIGTMASMVTSPDASWWQLHFSQLGNEGGAAGYRFNVSLIVTGLTLTVLANYIGNDVRRGLEARAAASPSLVRLLSWLFAGIGLCMAIAGAVPDAENIVVHVGAASGMLVLFGVFVWVSLRRLPEAPRELIGFSAFVVCGIVVAVLLWVPFHYYNLTGTEFTAASLLFAWLLVFVRTIGAYGSTVSEAVGDPAAAGGTTATGDPAASRGITNGR